MTIQELIQAIFSQMPPERQTQQATMMSPTGFMMGLSPEEAMATGRAQQQQVAPLSTAAGMVGYNAIPGMGMGGRAAGALSEADQGLLRDVAQQHLEGLQRTQSGYSVQPGRALTEAEQAHLAFLQKNKGNVGELQKFYPELMK